MGNNKRNRPDHDGRHRVQFDANKKIILAEQSFCALCGRPVDKSLKYPHPLSPSIDHIIPISMNGHPSDISNLQLTHLQCNKQKKNNLKPSRGPIATSARKLQLSTDWKNC